MKSLRSRLQPPTDPEAGFTIIEVMVAMMIFAIIAVGVAASLTSGLALTRDARSREVAANLAAQAIDVARSTTDIMAIKPINSGDPGSTVVVDGLTYLVRQSVGWVTSGGGDAACGTDDGVLQYKHINVRVTWAGRSAAVPAIQADTIIAPSSRITTPETGTILVSVVGVSGAGMPGITVTIAPAAVNPNGAQALATPAAPTDSQGCSYALKVVPGNYDVSISRAGYVNEKQLATVTKASQPVAAGDSFEADFQYDQANTVTAQYASNVGTSGILFPANLVTDWASENLIYQPTTTVPTSNKQVVFKLHPFPNGYAAFTGMYLPSTTNPDGTPAPDCLSPDPGQWKTPNASGVVGRRTATGSALPGAAFASTLPVPMGVVTVKNVSNLYLVAKPATAAAGAGDPGCGAGVTGTTAAKSAYYLNFSTKVTNTVNIALPFGTWQLFTASTSGGTTTTALTTGISFPSGSPATVSGSGVFTLDPRSIAP